MILKVWIAGSALAFAFGSLALALPEVTGWQAPECLLSTRVFVLVGGLPGVIYVCVTRAWKRI